MRGLSFACVAAVLLSGCFGSSRSQYGPNPFEPAREGQVSLWVENSTAEEVSIGVVGARGTTELVRVTSRGTSQISFTWPESQLLRFKIEAFSGGRHTTSPIPVQLGEQIDLIIRLPLNRSVVRR